MSFVFAEKVALNSKVESTKKDFVGECEIFSVKWSWLKFQPSELFSKSQLL